MNILLINNFDPCGMSIKLKNAINNLTEHNCRSITVSAVKWSWEKDIFIDDILNFEEIYDLINKSNVLQFNIWHWDDIFPFGTIKWEEFIWNKKVTVMISADYFVFHPKRYLNKLKSLGIKPLFLTSYMAEFFGTDEFIPFFYDIPPIDPVIEEKKKNSKYIKIGHSHSSATFGKGTPLFLDIMDKVSKKFDNIIIQDITNKPHDEYIKLLQSCDIVLSTISWDGLWGFVTMESMGLGIPTLTFSTDDILEKYKKVLGFSEIPMIYGNPDEIYNKLVELINDREKRQVIGNKSKEWVKKYWSREKIVPMFIDFYEKLPILKRI